MLFHFLGESTARQSAYGFIWPLSWSKIMLAWYMKSHYMILFFLVVMKMLFSFLSYLWKRYVSRPGHLPEAPPPPFVEMESLMGKVVFLLPQVNSNSNWNYSFHLFIGARPSAPPQQYPASLYPRIQWWFDETFLIVISILCKPVALLNNTNNPWKFNLWDFQFSRAKQDLWGLGA